MVLCASRKLGQFRRGIYGSPKTPRTYALNDVQRPTQIQSNHGPRDEGTRNKILLVKVFFSAEREGKGTNEDPGQKPTAADPVRRKGISAACVRMIVYCYR